MRSVKSLLFVALALASAIAWPQQSAAQATRMACTFRLVQARVGTAPARIARYNDFIERCPWDNRVTFARRQIVELEGRHRRRDDRRRPIQQSEPQAPPPAETSQLPTPDPPPAPPSPILRDLVVLDERGTGDARTMSDALALVREGGTVRIHPGHYPGNVRITKSVILIGDRDVRLQPVFENMTIRATGAVRIEGLKIEANGSWSALNIEAGDVELIDCTISASGTARQGRSMTTALFAFGGRTRVEGGTIGVGGDAAIIATGDSRISVQGATLAGGAGYGLYGTGQAQITVSRATVSGRIAILATGQTSLLLDRNTLVGAQREYVISLAGDVAAEIVGNRVAVSLDGRLVDATNRNWLRIAPTVTRMRILGNVSPRGRPLRIPTSASRRRGS